MPSFDHPIRQATTSHRRAGSDRGALAFAIAIGLALAATSGAVLSGIGSGAVENLARVTGFGRGEAIEQEQRRQANTMFVLERAVGAVASEIAALQIKGPGQTSRADVPVAARFARIDADIAALRSEIAAVRTAREEILSGTARAGTVDRLAADLQGARIEIADLRSSIDERDGARREEIAAITTRIARIEEVIAARDVTASIPATTHRRRPARAPLAGWTVRSDATGAPIVSHRGATFAALQGLDVPGLGPITAVRQRGDRWEVVTPKGTLVER